MRTDNPDRISDDQVNTKNSVPNLVGLSSFNLGQDAYEYFREIGESAKIVVRTFRRNSTLLGAGSDLHCDPDGLITETLERLDRLEGLLNPHRHPFHRHPFDDPKRRVEGFFGGVPLDCKPCLAQALGWLFDSHDHILEHCGVEKEISQTAPPPGSSWPYGSFLWWWPQQPPWPKPVLLEELDRSADCLMEILDDPGIQSFLMKFGSGSVEQGVTESDNSCRDQTGESGSQGAAGGTPNSNYLDLVLIPGSREVQREGYKPVKFGGRQLPWIILECLYSRKTGFSSKTDLVRHAWEFLHKSDPEDNTIWKQKSILAKMIKSLGLVIPWVNGLGYRLEERLT